MVEFFPDLQTFHFEYGNNRAKQMVCLGSRGMRGRFGKSSVGFQGFMEDLHVPPFLVGRGDCVPVGVQVATYQIQSSDAIILVFKDLAH